MTAKSRIWTDIDYDRDGKQVGWLHLPHSVTRSAYGTIAIPIAVIRNGPGPTAFLMAGNHGDEYEGQIALCRLIRELEPAEIAGRVIVLPAANLPAAMAGTRVSPIDDGNMNRSFPGDVDGGPTKQITHYIDTELFTRADFFHDLHSGGGSLAYVPFASRHDGDDPALNARAQAALEAFAAPISLVWKGHRDGRYSPIAAQLRGVPQLGSEFGGGGGVNVEALAFVNAGLRRLLGHLGIARIPDDPVPPTRFMSVPGNDWFVYAPDHGLFEPAVTLGATVRAGDLCGLVHYVDDPARPPTPCHFKRAGMVVCQRHPARVERGDCVAHLAIDGL
jgi:hypothetical protein